jgi:hypothetical protein
MDKKPTKPICQLCRKVGEDKYYYWLADKRGKGGKLCHLRCCERISELLNKNG